MAALQKDCFLWNGVSQEWFSCKKNMLKCEIFLLAICTTSSIWYLMAGISASLVTIFLFSSGACKWWDMHGSTQVEEPHTGLPGHSPFQRWFGSSRHFNHCLKNVNPCWLTTSQGSKGEKTILKWDNGDLSNGLWEYVWDLWTEVFEYCSRYSITEGTHVLHVLTALMTLIVHCCNLFWRNMF